MYLPLHRLVALYFCLHGAFLCDVFSGVTEVFPLLEAMLDSMG